MFRYDAFSRQNRDSSEKYSARPRRRRSPPSGRSGGRRRRARRLLVEGLEGRALLAVAPVDLTMTGGAVLENTALGVEVGQLSTIDADAGDTFTYSLVSGAGSADNASFSIQSNRLVAQTPFDYEFKHQLQVRIRSTDSGNLSVERSFTITVLDVDDFPPSNGMTPVSQADFVNYIELGARVETLNEQSASANGSRHVFTAAARNLVSGQNDHTGNLDVFLYDPLNQDGIVTKLVSHGVDGSSSSAAGDSRNARISADGRFVAFESNASNLVAGQSASGGYQVYLYDVATGVVTLVSRASTAASTPANGESQLTGISDDGSRIVFSSTATNLLAGQADGNGAEDVFLYDRGVNAVRLVSRSTAGAQTTAAARSNGARISGDGAWVAYASLASNLAAGITDNNGQDDIWLYSVATGQNTLVSHLAASATTTAGAGSFAPSISDDGAIVSFESAATNLVTAQVDTNGARDIFRYRRATNSLTLVSHVAGAANTAGNGASTAAALSGGGTFIAYQSTAKNLVAGMAPKSRTDDDVYLHSLSDDVTILASRDATALDSAHTAANGRSWQPSITDDGRYVAFLTQGSNLVEGEVDANGTLADGILFDRVLEASALLNGSADDALTSADGAVDSVLVVGLQAQSDAFAFFTSLGSNLLAQGLDNQATRDSFVFDTSTQLVDGASRNDILSPPTTSTGGGASPFSNYATTDDERYWVFTSPGIDIVVDTIGTPPTSGVGTNQVYLFDRFTFIQTLVSHAPGAPTTAGNGDSSTPLVSGESADGNRFVTFRSTATNLVAGTDANATGDVFLYDATAGTIQLVSRQSGTTTTAANGDSRPLAISRDGRRVLFASRATNLVAGQSDSNGGEDLFLFDRQTGAVTLVSHSADFTAVTANSPTSFATMSADGATIAYASAATNLVTGQSDSAGSNDAFLYATGTNTSTLISRSLVGASIAGNGASTQPHISELGNSVVFVSAASNLISGVTDSNGAADVFLYSTVGGTLQLVSRVAGSATQSANGAALDAVVNRDGTRVLYSTVASNVVGGAFDTNAAADLVLFDVSTGTAELVTRKFGTQATAASGGNLGAIAISDNGRYVAYDTTMTDLVSRLPGPAGSREVYQFDSQNDVTSLVTSRPYGATVNTSRLTGFGSSGDFVGLSSDSDLLIDWDYNFLGDSFLWSAPTDPPNEAPTNILLSSASVNENLPIGTVVGALSTTDADVGESFTYELVGGPGGDDNGSFELNGSTLVTSAVFHQTDKTSRQVRIRSTDSNGAFVEKSFTITITGDFNGPTNITLSRSAVSEMLRGATVGAVTVVNPDGNATHTLTTNDSRFAFTGNTLKLKTTDFLNRTVATTITLTITATDDAVPPHVFNKQFTLDVLSNPTPWRNPLDSLDVNPDTFVAPQDALIVINELNASGSHALLPPLEGEAPPPPWFDTDGDNFVAPIDALLVINFLNQQAGQEGEDLALPVDPLAASYAAPSDEEPPVDEESDEPTDDEVGPVEGPPGDDSSLPPEILSTTGGPVPTDNSASPYRTPVALNLLASSGLLRSRIAAQSTSPLATSIRPVDDDAWDDVLETLAQEQAGGK